MLQELGDHIADCLGRAVEAERPPPGAIFDPETVAVLIAAYEKAIEGHSAFVRGVIAKRIIELASEGERDTDKLCQGALALSIRKPRSRFDRPVTASREPLSKTPRP